LTLQNIGLAAPTFSTTTTAPVGSAPEVSDVVTASGVIRAPLALGVKPPRLAVNVPVTGIGLDAETGPAQLAIVEQPMSGTEPGTIVPLTSCQVCASAAATQSSAHSNALRSAASCLVIVIRMLR
jgi:hypothetical protein